jgi:hypothetical protein
MTDLKTYRLWFGIFLIFVAGVLIGSIISSAPYVEDDVKLRQTLHQRELQVEEYRLRCIDWSHYVFQLENGEYVDGR